MICSSFKSENLVIMQILTASSFWPETYNLLVHFTLYRYAMYNILCHETLSNFHFYSTFVFLLESTKTSSMAEKSLNKSFQTSYRFLGAPNFIP